MNLLAYLFLIGIPGVLAGYFLGSIPIAVISVIGVAFIVWMKVAMKSASGDAELAAVMMTVFFLVFLLPMWATAIIVRIELDFSWMPTTSSWLFR